MGTLAFALLFAAAAGVFIALPVVRKPSRTGQRIEARGDERAHLALIERKDRALAALKELEFDHRTGKVSDVDYRELIAPIRLEAAEALKPLEGVAVGAHRSVGARKKAGRPRARLAAAGDQR